MKFKHNKKQNSAFLYESLIRELSRSIVKENSERKKIVLSILKKFFSKSTEINKELKIFQLLENTQNVDIFTAERILNGAKEKHEKEIDKKKLHEQKSVLTKTINKYLGNSVFSNFVPNYKNIASIYQIFNMDEDIAKRILMENVVVSNMSTLNSKKEQKMKPIDNLAFKMFIKDFNKQYGNTLLKEQKTVLQKYVSSFFNRENKVSYKIFLNKELERIKNVLSEYKKGNEESLKSKVSKLEVLLEDVKNRDVSKETLVLILKLQKLTGEIENGS